MNSEGVTLIKVAGKSVPEDLLKHLFEQQYSAFIGVSLVHEDGKRLVNVRATKKLNVPDIHKMLEAQKAKHLIVHFGKQAQIDDNLQPFTILENADGNPLLVASLDGDFSEFAQTESTKSDAAMCVERELIPRIKKLYGFVGSDIDKLMAELQEDQYIRDFSQFMIGDRGSIVLHACNGVTNVIAVHQDETFLDTEFGSISNHLGFYKTEEPAEEGSLENMMQHIHGGKVELPHESGTVQEAAPAASNSVPTVGRKGPVRPGAKAAVQVASTEPISRPADSGASGNGPSRVPTVPRADKAAPAAANGGADSNIQYVMIKIPKNMSAKERVKFIRNRTPGKMVPPNAEKLEEFPVPINQMNDKARESWNKQEGKKGMEVLATSQVALNAAKAGGNAELPKEQPAQAAQAARGPKRPGTQASVMPTNAPQPVVGEYPERSTSATAEGPKKDTSTHQIGKEVPDVISEPLPIIPPSQKREAVAFFDKQETKDAIDNHSRFISDPNNYAKLEEGVPNFAEQLGFKDMNEMHHWPYPIFRDMAKGSWEVAAVACYWLAVDNLKKQRDIDALLETPTKSEPETQKATGTHGATPTFRGPRRPGTRAM